MGAFSSCNRRFCFVTSQKTRVVVVGTLTDQPTPKRASTYWAVLKGRLKKEGADEMLTTCKQLKLKAADGKMYPTDVADLQTLFRIIQSIPSAKAEPIKQWLSKVASERIDEIQDPEKAIDRGYEYYRRLGYSEAWINERMKGKSCSHGSQRIRETTGTKRCYSPECQGVI